MADKNYKYTKAYDQKNTIKVSLKLNVNTDADIIEYLDNVDNKQGTIKKLIRDDIAKKSLYLIYCDSKDDYATIKGYIAGTEEDARKYCKEYYFEYEEIEDIERSKGD